MYVCVKVNSIGGISLVHSLSWHKYINRMGMLVLSSIISANQTI
jgi:hypothetical protein